MDLKQWLESTGMPVRELFFRAPPAPPYLVFSQRWETGGADLKNVIDTRRVMLELYTKQIDAQAQAKVEALLDAAGIHYTKESGWLDKVSLVMTWYEFELREKRRVTHGGR